MASAKNRKRVASPNGNRNPLDWVDGLIGAINSSKNPPENAITLKGFAAKLGMCEKSANRILRDKVARKELVQKRFVVGAKKRAFYYYPPPS